MSAQDIEITPDDLVQQVKQQGAFDRMRKRLLTEFQEHEHGKRLLEQVDRVARDLAEHSPHVLRSRAYFHRAVLDQLERKHLYDDLKRVARQTFLDKEAYQIEMRTEIKTSLATLRRQAEEKSKQQQQQEEEAEETMTDDITEDKQHATSTDEQTSGQTESTSTTRPTSYLEYLIGNVDANNEH
ncbi:hypothetical protein BDF19DRAFT_410419 [Syncephalis fuscata]|nr:hypothetical protein BDF19DRAFT_410419 [Syncephalis fuscata]